METDQAVAKEMVAKLITDIEKNSARGFDPWLENDERLERLRSGIDDAYFVYVADEPESKTNYLTTVVLPNEPLFFGYTSIEHEEQSRPLLERFAKAIDYDIEK